MTATPPDVLAAWDALRRARNRAVRKLRMGGVPRAAWEADRRVDAPLWEFRLTGAAKAKREMLAAIALAVEAFDAATAGKLVELRREVSP